MPVAADPVEASHAPPLATADVVPVVVDVAEARSGQELGGEGEFREFRESQKRGSADRILRVSRCPKKGSEAVVSAVAMDGGARARLADLDVRAIRAGLGMTQGAFASTFGLPVSTLQDWEQGRSAPDQAARVLLAVIGYRPDAVRGALAGYG